MFDVNKIAENRLISVEEYTLLQRILLNQSYLCRCKVMWGYGLLSQTLRSQISLCQ